MSHHPTSAEDSPAIEEEVATVASTLRAGIEDHPSARQLSDYHRGALAPGAAETLRDHLAQCPQCSELLLDLAGFAGLGDDATRRDWDERHAAAWQSLQAATTPPTGETSRRPARWAPLAAAAVLLLAVGLAGGWLLQRQGAELERARADLAAAEARITALEATATPWVNVVSHDLFPSSYERGGEPSEPLALAAETELVLLRLHTRETAEPRIAVLRISRAEGGEVWTGSNLRRAETGSFRLAVPRRLLPPGRYRLELRDDASDLLESYGLVVE